MTMSTRWPLVFTIGTIIGMWTGSATAADKVSNDRKASKGSPMSDTPASQFTEIRTLWDFNDPKKSEANFRELVPKAEQAGETSYRLQLLTQVARAQGLQRKFDEAHKTLDDVKAALPQAPAVVQVRYLLERGRVFNSSQKAEESKPLFLVAWNVATKAGEDNLGVDAAHMLGIVETPDEALRWNEKALSLAESSSDPACRNWLGSLYNNIGWTYHDQKKDYEKALAVFKKALAFFEEKKNPGPILIGRYAVGRTLRSMNRLDEALAMQQAIQKEYEKTGNEDGYVLEEIAECQLALNHADEAQKSFALAYKSLSKDDWLVANEPDRLARLKKLGKVE